MKSPNADKRVTIRQVAARAGVSVSAVSKVLRDAYGVSPAMRARVLASIDELHYRPLASARALRGRNFSIGFVLPDIRNSFFAEILNGAAMELRAAHYQLILGVRETAGSDLSVIESMLDRQVDGIVLVGTELNSGQLERLGARIPLVAVAHHPTARSRGFDTVNNDDLLGARLAVRHLLASGFANIAMVSLAGTKSTSIARREKGYRLEMEDSGCGQQVSILPSAPSLTDIRLAAKHVFTASAKRSAVFCWCDLVAFQFISIALETGRSIPDEIGVIGYDNSALCDLSQHQLTSIHQSGPELGRKAAALLVERLNGRISSEHVLLEPWVAIRRSTGNAVTETVRRSRDESGSPTPC
jgi:DNA-binding LacI/PurR family transcriptional regulator